MCAHGSHSHHCPDECPKPAPAQYTLVMPRVVPRTAQEAPRTFSHRCGILHPTVMRALSHPRADGTRWGQLGQGVRRCRHVRSAQLRLRTPWAYGLAVGPLRGPRRGTSEASKRHRVTASQRQRATARKQQRTTTNDRGERLRPATEASD